MSPPHPTPPPSTPSQEVVPDPAWSGWRGPALIALIIFSSALVGILSRPINYTSALWPANPILAALMVRHPHLSRKPTAWLAAFAGFITADFVTGSSWLPTLWFTCANMVGAYTACWVLLRTDLNTRSMQSQYSALILFAAALSGAVIGGVVGSGTGPVLFQAELWPSTAMWVGGELLSYTLILPVVLAFPRQYTGMLRPLREWWSISSNWQHWGPLLAVLVSVAIALKIGGPGTLSFVVPALLWCALTFSLMVTAVLCLVVCLILTVEVAMGSFSFTPEFWLTALSLRVGITLLALGPMAVATTRIARKRAIDQLDHTINHDFLTSLLSRNAFFQLARQQFARLNQGEQPCAMLVMDIDHFKRVNDSLGHPAGDDVLRQFAQVAMGNIRGCDLLGRMGGEEFLALLPDVSPGKAQAIAQQICDAVRSHPFTVAGQSEPLRVTLSIGLIHCANTPPSGDIDVVIHCADVLLYKAKQGGRDQVQFAPYSTSSEELNADLPFQSTLHRRHAAGSH